MFEIYPLEHIQVEQGPLLGQKALGLGKALEKGLPVLPGLVVSAQVLQLLLEQIPWPDPLFADLPHSSLHLDIENYQQLQAIAQQIRHQIMTLAFPKELSQAIRDQIQPFANQPLILRPSLSIWSSDLASLLPNPIADEYSSALFNSQICQAALPEVELGIKQIWADLFGAKSLYYWQKQEVSLYQVHLAILLQPCLPAIAAGRFELRGNRFEVQAVKGLGIALSRQEATPDRYTIELSAGKTQRQAGHQTIAYRLTPNFEVVADLLEFNAREVNWVLSETQLKPLNQLANQLQAAFDQPITGEWLIIDPSHADQQLYLTQVQPLISTASNSSLQPPMALPIEPPLLESPSLEWSASMKRRTGVAVSPGLAIAPTCVITDENQSTSTFEPGSILVARALPPQWFPLIKQAAGMVLEQGSQTSHSAILARELRIPAVMGVADATATYQMGNRLVVDGDRGLVYPVSETLANAPQPFGSTQSLAQVDTWPLIGTQVMVNVSHPDSFATLANLPIDGIGLLRSELLMMTVLAGRSPMDWLQQGQGDDLTRQLAQVILPFVQAISPRPVFYRSLDWLNQEFETTPLRPVVPNPMLGLRGAFCYSLDPTLFKLELVALRQVQQQGGENLRLLLPFIRTVEEFQFCRSQIEQAGLLQCASFQVWIMAEVPSVIFLLPDLVKAGVQGIAIGSNDLTQLILGVDRDVALFANTFDERHPAVKAAIAQLIRQAQQLGIPCSICGQAPSRYPDLVEWLVQLGISSVSVEPEAVATTYQAIARSERRLLLDQVRSESTNLE